MDLTDHDDEDVVDAAHENMAMAEAMASISPVSNVSLILAQRALRA